MYRQIDTLRPALDRLLRHYGHDLAIDLGAITTRVYARGTGIILDEPSVVAVDRHTREVLEAGHAAHAAATRSPGTMELVHPARRGRG